MATKIDRFLELVLKSSLLSPSAMCEACAGFEMSSANANALSDLCEHLISKGALTRWQCDKLCSGKWKGFFLDGYCLLSRLSVDETTSTFLCKEVASGKRVAMAVTPPTYSADGRFHHAVRELSDDESTGET
jgi:hypothetical protein